jgi:hypothetical protein
VSETGDAAQANPASDQTNESKLGGPLRAAYFTTIAASLQPVAGMHPKRRPPAERKYDG